MSGPVFTKLAVKVIAIGGHPNYVIFNSVRSVITTWQQTHEFVRWTPH